VASVVRASMDQLTDRMRSLIGDPAGQKQQYSDLQIQDRLDLHRKDHPYTRIKEQDDIAPGGGILWKTFWGPPFWERDATLINSSYQPIVADDVNYLIGRWTFNAARTDTPLYAIGKTYDVYQTAADLLNDWLAALAREFDFSAGGQSFSRSQKFKQMQDLITTYKRKAGAGAAVVQIGRSDIMTAGSRTFPGFGGVH
jgi:hypothetical protein